ncbi:probable ADP-ribosylation factor GTPase-activating protein AGD9 isoform X2 [Salvia miltiorrhiza]|uniref:probable ADP-ribosylation factor GTPase-activating protein AGD9 isoform X2 n=1 Tax=Salvia miltiorrhiza TaxID=226208 RepID=UPI0025AD8A79|nr:probable ADP-ribosylation factor GTPase-activating protein AGD9 isoform X2 [Salvia miltiorrhiza]
MPRRVKEEEKVENIIRGLLKQPDNRRCINCCSLGPQYVCTTFWTFVCTNCSGVHREFTHRVKSVSVAKFSDEEIMSLQAGGNERAKQIYFKSWDPHHNSYPNSSNLQRLREFVRDVYIDRRYAGENSFNKQPLAQPSLQESRGGFCEWPSEMSRWGRRDDYLGRSPPVERGHSIFERSSSDRGLNLKDFLEERSPRNNQVVMPRSSSHRARSTRFEIVDDRFREDGSVKRYERGSGSGGRSPISLKSAASAFLEPPPRAAAAVDDHKASPRGQPKAADADEKGNEAKNTPTNLIDFLDEDSNTAASPSAAIVPITSVEALLFELSSPMASKSCVTVMTRDEANLPHLQSAASLESSLNEGSRSPAAPDDLRRTRSVPAVQSLAEASSARKEIPEDLFTPGFASFNPPAAGWAPYMNTSRLQQPAAAYQNPPRPRNPFDIDDDRFQVQAATLSYMSPLQGAHQNMLISSPYLSPQSHPLVPGAYMPNNMLLTRPEGRGEDAFASPLPRAGNPFG